MVFQGDGCVHHFEYWHYQICWKVLFVSTSWFHVVETRDDFHGAKSRPRCLLRRDLRRGRNWRVEVLEEVGKVLATFVPTWLWNHKICILIGKSSRNELFSWLGQPVRLPESINPPDLCQFSHSKIQIIGNWYWVYPIWSPHPSNWPRARVPGYFFKAVKTATCSAWQVDVKERTGQKMNLASHLAWRANHGVPMGRNQAVGDSGVWQFNSGEWPWWTCSLGRWWEVIWNDPNLGNLAIAWLSLTAGRGSCQPVLFWRYYLPQPVIDKCACSLSGRYYISIPSSGLSDL